MNQKARDHEKSNRGRDFGSGGAGLVFLAIGWPITNKNPVSDVIICFGDSLTFGTGASTGMDYPSRLSRLLGKPVINAGVPGNTTADALQRLEADVLEKNPGYVLLTLGGNDLKNRVGKATAFSNLEAIVRSIQSAGAMVVLGGIDIPMYGRGFGEAYKELAEKTGSVLIPNVFEGIMGKSSLMSDPIHPNDAGYEKMAAMFHETLKPYL